MGFADKVQNAKDQAVGKVKETAGDATDNEQLQTEGAAQKFDGDVGQKVEQGKDKLNDAVNDLKN
ncbi:MULTISPECIES: CsbD family protein [unclassified Luteococcus]|uniref:CsbD family protein n=1 Tax=unclassified Luteococcus TaxID=2639923 RepID=UPI00313C465A